MSVQRLPEKRRDWTTTVTMVLASCALIGLQLSLVQALSESHFYHFTYLVISVALLGSGAAGVFLVLARRAFERAPRTWIVGFLGGFAVTTAVGLRIAERLPIDIQYLLFDVGQVGLLVVYMFLLLLPFFCIGGAVAGIVLEKRREAGWFYGANLIGSGIGGISAPLLLSLAPAHHVVPGFAVPAAAAFLLSLSGLRSYGGGRGRIPALLSTVIVVCVAAWTVVFPPERTIDQYKMSYQVRLQEEAGRADRVTERHSPRGWIEAYTSPTFHYTMFAGLQAEVEPPEQAAVLLDGELAGSVFTIPQESSEASGDRSGTGSSGEHEPADHPAAIMDHTPQSLVYRVQKEIGGAPRVLLLGDTGGANVWLARRFGAEEITVVHGNPAILDTVSNDLAEYGGWILDEVRTVAADPRRYLEKSAARGEEYDIVHIAEAEGMPATTRGLGALREDFLLTAEGFGTARDVLSERGMISITRGVQTPARDTLRVLTTTGEMLRRRGLAPAEHVVMARNYLAATTIISKSALPAGSSALNEVLPVVRSVADPLVLDIEYYPGIDSARVEQRNRVPGPEGAEYSYYHYAARRILEGDSPSSADGHAAAGPRAGGPVEHGDPESFVEEWVYDISPATDQRPYFHTFFSWGGVERIVETFGPEWFRRLELGYVVLVISAAGILLLAALILPVPTLLAGSPAPGRRLRTLVFFTGTGLGFIGLEMNWIAQFTRYLGDPLYSATVVLTTMLVGAGLGSILQARFAQGGQNEHSLAKAERRIAVAAAALLVLIGLSELLMPALFRRLVASPAFVRFGAAAVLTFPAGMLLGVFFPAGLEILNREAPSHVPLAWAVDGFASVAAAPLAVLVAMSFGFRTVAVAAMLCYAVVAASALIPSRRVSKRSL
ncbi:MAG: hypothetical protein ACOCRN_00075 [Spirochaetia bacterium]